MHREGLKGETNMSNVHGEVEARAGETQLQVRKQIILKQ